MSLNVMFARGLRAFVTLALVGGCLAAPATPAWAEPFTDPNERYALVFPTGWTAAPDPSVPHLMAATPPASAKLPGSSIKVVSTDLAAGMTLERYVENSLAGYKKIWTVRENSEVVLPAGKARRLILDQDLTEMNPKLPPAKAKTRLLKVFLANGEQVYVITCASAPADFAKALPAYEDVIRSLRILPPPAPGALRRLDAPTFTTSHPASWQSMIKTMGMEAILVKRVGQDKLSIMVSHEPTGDVVGAIEATRRNHADGKLGRITAESDTTIGSRKAHRFAFFDPTELYSFWEEYYVAAPSGYHHIRVAFDGEDRKPPAELLKDVEAVLASWSWK